VLAALRAPGVPLSLLAVALLLVIRALDPVLLEDIRLRGFDLEQRLAPRPHVPSPVVIVAIDEASLAPPWGQWPWPRTLMARLVRKIAEGHPSVLGVDIIFSEPDRSSPDQLAAIVPNLPPELAQALAALGSNDAALAEAFRSVPTVLGMGVSLDQPVAAPARFTPTPVRGIGGDPKPFLPSFPTLIRSLPEITAAERGRAALVGDPDRDGIVRRVPLFIVGAGNIVPGLTVEMLRVALGAGGIGVAVSADGIAGGRLGDVPLPTDARGRAYPYFTPLDRLTIVSAADLLDGSLDPASLTGRAVLLGVTGLGLVDLKQTPLGLMQGIAVHAELLESILSQEVLRRPASLKLVELGMVLVAGLLVIFGLSYHRPRLAAAGLGAIVVLCLGGGFVAFRVGHLLLDGTYPSAAAIVTFGMMLAANLRVAEADRRRLAEQLEREKEAKLRLEGELGAARAIQMGLLPRGLADTPESRSIDLHALIESARMVGGDLYDFMMLDDTHLFFAVADVAGKGIAAAIFMAMTKEVLHAATLRHGEALGRVFAEANRKISDASTVAESEGARPTFVTVFAAVLDLRSGVILYVSAGHDAPYVLRGGGGPFRLDTEGGPPLGCAIEDEDYPVDRAQLEPGDVLLLYTDGVTEAKNAGEALYSTARLQATVEAIPSTSAKSVVEHVREDVRRFVAAAEQADDLTLLAIRWLGPDA
jgi:serine phosphatase RsbU (regulator of sigma subunit)/CHASE2 domain-containing sensor protein